MPKFEAKKGDFAKIWQKLGGYSLSAPPSSAAHVPRIFLAAFEALRHMLDFRSSVSCYPRVRIANLWLGDLDNHVCHELG